MAQKGTELSENPFTEESTEEPPPPWMLKHICREMAALNLPAKTLSEADVASAIIGGEASSLYRLAITALINEFLGKAVPSDVQSGFNSVIARTLRHATEFYPSLLLQDDSGASVLSQLQTSASARLALWLSLISEVRTNRLLEYRRYQQAPKASLTSVARASASSATKVPAKASKKGATGVERSSKYTLSVAQNELRIAAQIPSEVRCNEFPSWIVSNCLQRKTPLLHSAVDRSKMSQEQQKALADACEILRNEYRTRRQLLIRRFAQTLATMCEAEEATVDKASLHALAAERLAQLSSEPSVELTSVFSVTLAEVLASNEKISAGGTKFKDRNKMIPDVPDRGGRINTYNFDAKIETAVRKADTDMRSKGSTAQQQRDTARQQLETDRRQGIGLGAHGAGQYEHGRGGGHQAQGGYGGGQGGYGGGHQGQGGYGGGYQGQGGYGRGQWQRGGRGGYRY